MRAAREIEAAARAVGALPTDRGAARRHEPADRRTRPGAVRRASASSIALARAELVDPDLLLLDEATATLDPATERAVLDAGRHASLERGRR